MEDRASNNGLFECIQCGKKFLEITSLLQHKNVHKKASDKPLSIQKPFKCSHCSKTYSHKSSLSAHFRQTHVEKHIETHVCSICQMEFLKGCDLTTHVSYEHSDVKNCINHTTMKGLENKTELAMLPIASNEQKNVNQDSLPNSHVIRKPLRELMQDRGQPERNFVCLICKTSFLRAINLKAHMVTHSDNPLNTCKHCDARFKSHHALSFHRDQVHYEVRKSYVKRMKLETSIQETCTNRGLAKEESQSNKQIHIRHSTSVDPELWPKVVMSRKLNDMLRIIE